MFQSRNDLISKQEMVIKRCHGVRLSRVNGVRSQSRPSRWRPVHVRHCSAPACTGAGVQGVSHKPCWSRLIAGEMSKYKSEPLRAVQWLLNSGVLAGVSITTAQRTVHCAGWLLQLDKSSTVEIIADCVRELAQRGLW